MYQKGSPRQEKSLCHKGVQTKVGLSIAIVQSLSKTDVAKFLMPEENNDKRRS